MREWMTVSSELLWRPEQYKPGHSHLSRFIRYLGEQGIARIEGWDALHEFSIEEPEAFWGAVIEYTGLKLQKAPDAILRGDSLISTEWLPGAQLNFAENLLAPVAAAPGQAERIISFFEDGRVVRHSNQDLLRDVASLAAWLRQSGVGAGDRVAGILGHGYEAIVAMLATTSIGAIWSSASPDFGVEAIVDRFGQIEPRVLIVANGYGYGGRLFERADQIPALRDGLSSVERVVIVRQQPECAMPGDDQGESWADVLASRAGAPLAFTPVPASHPVCILFSSGTTGVPKCIVHGTAGLLLNHASELFFHADLQTGDRFLYFTTCGWMMWNWQISGLLADAVLVTYDGSPGYPDLDRLWRIAESERLTHFGASARYLAACRQSGLKPSVDHDLSQLRMVFSTGSPLLASEFDWFYQDGAPHALLGSIIGGTDICGCFLGSNPLLPLRRGEIQAPMLGKDVAAFDEDGHPVAEGRGELVCRSPVPSMPVGFWNDKGGHRYRSAYFERFPGVWAHGDFIGFTASGGAIVYGRSDTTLNPGGVRIGTAEIYRQVEILPEVLDSLVAGRPVDGDEEIVLLVKLKPGYELDEAARQRLKQQIKTGASPRHVPRQLLAVSDIPYSRSGKKVEIAITKMLRGEDFRGNISALANPESLDEIWHILDRAGLI